MDTMRTALAGEACLAPTKPCRSKAINTILLPLQGAHELRLFIPKHHCRLLRARRASPYGGASITACHGAPLQPQCNLKICSANFTGEACLAPTKPCRSKAINTILLPLQGAHELRLFIPKHHCRLLRARRASPYGGGSITACHGAPLQPQCYLKIRSAHFACEACLARRVMTCIIRIACDYFMA